MTQAPVQMDLFACPQGLQEENGEFLDGKTAGRGWAIKVARFQDGLWRAAPDYMGKDWGFLWPLSGSLQGHPSRVQAIQEAAAVLVFYLGKQAPSPLHRRSLADMEKLMEMAQ